MLITFSALRLHEGRVREDPFFAPSRLSPPQILIASFFSSLNALFYKMSYFAIYERLLLFLSIGRYFIGLSDYSDAGNYKWIGGIVPAYTNWAPAHPQGSSTDCVVLDIRHQGDRDHGKWLSEHCSNNHKFICECPGACTQS